MIKGLLLIMILGLLIAFNWGKVPKPVKTALEDAKTVSGEVIENGSDMPDPVKEYMDTTLRPKLKKFIE